MLVSDALTVTGVSLVLLGTVGVLLGDFEVLSGTFEVTSGGIGVLLGTIVVSGNWVPCDDLVLSCLISQSSHNTIRPSLHINPKHQSVPLVAKSPSS